MFVLSSSEDRYTCFETLYYEHMNNTLIILQEIIKSQRFMKVSIILVVLKNMIKWLDISLPTDLTKYNIDHQINTTNDTRRAKNKLINQGVKTTNESTNVHYYNINQELILSNIVTESDIYNNYSYNSCVNWEIEKTLETHPKKLECYIDKPETDLKKIDFNIIVNDNEINDMNDDKIAHPSDDQADDIYSNIKGHKIEQEQTNHNSLYILADNKIQLSSHLEDLNKANDWKSTNIY